MSFESTYDEARISPGEEFIQDFLLGEKIRFVREKHIHYLNGDSASFRRADFYLKDYRVYVEFLGQWYDPEQQKRYKEKMRVYHLNNVPCLYIYPEHLGNLEHWFDKGLRSVFQSPFFRDRLDKEFLRYRSIRLGRELWQRLALMFLVGWVFVVSTSDNESLSDVAWLVLMATVFVYQAGIVIKDLLVEFKSPIHQGVKYLDTDCRDCNNSQIKYQSDRNSPNMELISAIVDEVEAKAIDLTVPNKNWYTIGYVLSEELGEPGRQYFHRLSKIGPMYDEAKCDSAYSKIIEENRGTVRLGSLIYICKEAGVHIPLAQEQ